MKGRAFLMLPWFLCAPVFAQEYAQWAWEGSVGAISRRYSESVGETPASRVSQRRLNLSLGLGGFIIHPAIASFRLGVEGDATKHGGDVGVNTKRFGYRGDLRILPQSIIPLQLFASRNRYGYDIKTDDPYLLSAVPDGSSSYGASLRIRRGFLGGLLASSERTTVSFVAAGQRAQTIGNDHLDWSTATRSLQQHYRLERQTRDYGSLGYRLADLTFTGDDHGSFERFRWDMITFVLHRSISAQNQTALQADQARIENHFATVPKNGHTWDLQVASGFSGAGQQGKLQTHDLTLRYLHDPFRGWQIIPFAGYGLQVANGTTLTAPKAGVGVDWSGSRRDVDLALVSAADWMLLRSSGTNAPPSQTRIAWSIGGSAGHGSDMTLRKEILLSISRNQLRMAGETFAPSPITGATLIGAGTEDVQAGRLTLRRRWDDIFLVSAYTDYSSRRSTMVFEGAGYQATNLANSIQLTTRTFGLLLNAGNASIQSTTAQHVRYFAGSVSWRPFRLLTLTAMARRDRRQTVYEPPLDGERIEAGGSLQIGAFYVVPEFFRSRERLRNEQQRRTSGFTLSVSRRFGGWLPIISAPERRGVVK